MLPAFVHDRPGPGDRDRHLPAGVVELGPFGDLQVWEPERRPRRRSHYVILHATRFRRDIFQLDHFQYGRRLLGCDLEKLPVGLTRLSSESRVQRLLDRGGVADAHGQYALNGAGTPVAL